MIPADPREVLGEVRFRALQIRRLLGMLDPGAVPLAALFEHQASNTKLIATIDAALRARGGEI